MAGRPKIFDEQQAIEKATQLFWKKGYESTSTEDLLQAMGVQRGSFYHTFGSKKQLFLESIKLYEANSFMEFKRVLNESESPIELIKSSFFELANCSEEEHYRGCFAGNILTELSNIDEELTEKARFYLKTMENIFFEQIKIAQVNGQLKTKTNAKLLAKYLITFWNGINITRRLYPDSKAIHELIEFQLALLN